MMDMDWNWTCAVMADCTLTVIGSSPMQSTKNYEIFVTQKPYSLQGDSIFFSVCWCRRGVRADIPIPERSRSQITVIRW